MENREIEAKFLEINKNELIAKLQNLGAKDLGEDLVRDIIFYDKDGKWKDDGKTFARIRNSKQGMTLTYKNEEAETALGMEEIEFGIDNIEKAKEFLGAVGLVLSREQEKKRHKFKFGEATVDIDTWPGVPTYVELEGPSEESIKQAAEDLAFDWSQAVFGNAGRVLKKYYGIPIFNLRYFTFDKVE